MNLDGHEIADARSLLRLTDRTLGVVIARAIGVDPALTVVSQSVEEPPHPAWAVPPLGTIRKRKSRLLIEDRSIDEAAIAPSGTMGGAPEIRTRMRVSTWVDIEPNSQAVGSDPG